MKATRTHKIGRGRLSEVVASRIKDDILDGGLVEGDRLPTEQQMADMFGVSRVSVRETTKALSFLGITRSAPRRGASRIEPLIAFNGPSP